MNTYLTQAKNLYLLSKEEFNKAKRLNNNEVARDASGKAWIATTDALRGFLLSCGLKEKQLPKSERQRHDMMAQYCNEQMLFSYYFIRSELHENAYYEGMINYMLLFKAMNEVKKFIHRCGNGG
ncbi:MAG: hypothetical protein FVQ77_00625 [Cytophagales bacterium]|nr:hypothetical protein [Cytophagales bacterium]